MHVPQRIFHQICRQKKSRHKSIAHQISYISVQYLCVYIYVYVYVYFISVISTQINLVGGFNHLEKYEFVNGTDYHGLSPYDMENKKCLKPPTSNILNASKCLDRHFNGFNVPPFGTPTADSSSSGSSPAGNMIHLWHYIAKWCHQF